MQMNTSRCKYKLRNAKEIELGFPHALLTIWSEAAKKSKGFTEPSEASESAGSQCG